MVYLSVMDKFFLGRQPIVDSNEIIYGYELLFRDDSYHNVAIIKDAFGAITTTLFNVLSRFGVSDLIGEKYGFINLNREFLLSEFVELIPKDNFVLEILENTKVDDLVLNRICELKSRGYKFALDDFVFDASYIENFKPLLDKVQYIKVDYPLVKSLDLEQKIKILNKLSAKLVAEKLENFEEYKKCKELGFHLFQGYFFARPTIFETQYFDPSKVTVVKIINMINQDKPINYIVQVFEIDPILSFNFLKFINSAAFFFRTNIKSIRHAISLIGLKKLENWLLLMSFANKHGKKSVHSPLFQTAVIRAKTMELLAQKVFHDEEKKDEAFLAGLLSLIDILFGKSKNELIKSLGLDIKIEKAILEYEGKLGVMLQAVIYDEDEDFDNLKSSLEKLNIEFSFYSEAKLKSYAWLNELISSLWSNTS
jgi:EAL and modified HD-GYP domain-containing signal transduction protein